MRGGDLGGPHAARVLCDAGRDEERGAGVVTKRSRTREDGVLDRYVTEAADVDQGRAVRGRATRDRAVEDGQFSADVRERPAFILPGIPVDNVLFATVMVPPFSIAPRA